MYSLVRMVFTDGLRVPSSMLCVHNMIYMSHQWVQEFLCSLNYVLLNKQQATNTMRVNHSNLPGLLFLSSTPRLIPLKRLITKFLNRLPDLMESTMSWWEQNWGGKVKRCLKTNNDHVQRVALHWLPKRIPSYRFWEGPENDWQVTVTLETQ